MSKKRGEMSITKRIKLTNDLIYKMYNGGMTFAEIGEVLHLDKSRILDAKI